MADDADSGSRPWRAARGIAAWVLVILTALAVTGMVIGLWLNRTVFETDAFMNTVSPVVESEAVQTLVADQIADALIDALDLENRMETALSDAEDRLVSGIGEALDLSDTAIAVLQRVDLGLGSLASPVAAGVEARIREVVTNVVTSPDGEELLLDVIQVSHEKIVLLLRDETDQLPLVVVEEGEVRVNLVPLMAEVLRRTVNEGIDLVGIDREIPAFDSAEDADASIAKLASFLGRDLPPDFGQVRIASEESLQTAQNLASAFDRATWYLVIAALVLATLAVVLTQPLWQGLVRVGIAAAVAVAAGWIATETFAAYLPSATSSPEGGAAVNDVAQAVVNSMTGFAVMMILLGIVVAAGGFWMSRRTMTANEDAPIG
jgi:uncharacterized protein YneF (UPF0154 family)